VLASVKSALKLGYKVTVVSDALAGATAESRDHACKRSRMRCERPKPARKWLPN